MLAGCMVPEQKEDGEEIIKQGDTDAHEMYIISMGEAKAVVRGVGEVKHYYAGS